VVPAIAIDLLLRRFGRLSNIRLAALMAPVFVATFVVVQWPFADFLMTPWARLVFATDRMAYMVPPVVQGRWYRLEPADNLMIGLSIAIVLAFLSCWRGLSWGAWMARVQR